MSYLKKRIGIKTVISDLAAVGTTTIFRILIDGQLPSKWVTYHATIDHVREERIVDDLFLVFYDFGWNKSQYRDHMILLS